MDDEIEEYRKRMQEKFYAQNNPVERPEKEENFDVNEIKTNQNVPVDEKLIVQEVSSQVEQKTTDKKEEIKEMISDYEIAKRLQDMYNKETNEDARARANSERGNQNEESKRSQEIEMSYRNYRNNGSNVNIDLNENPENLLLNDGQTKKRSSVITVPKFLTIFFCILIIWLMVFSINNGQIG